MFLNNDRQIKNLSKSLGVTRIKPAQIKSSVVFLNRLGTQPPIIPLDYDLDKFKICLSNWGVTRIKPAQIKSSVVFPDLKHNRIGTQSPIISLDYDLDKIKVCLSHWGVTRIKLAQTSSTNQVLCSSV
jgi:hypothetical protein